MIYDRRIRPSMLLKDLEGVVVFLIGDVVSEFAEDVTVFVAFKSGNALVDA